MSSRRTGLKVRMSITGADLPILIGRGSTCGLHIDEARVSRTHARVDWMGGSLQITDVSINGTYVRFTGDDEVLSLRRGACTLHGSGDIGLGGSPNEVGVPLLRFNVMSSPDDTMPMRLSAPPERGRPSPPHSDTHALTNGTWPTPWLTPPGGRTPR